MTAPWRRLAPSLIRTTAAAALAAGSLTVVTGLPAQAADPVRIQILGINDFHGRIDPAITPGFATTIEKLRIADPSGDGTSTALVGAGDLIGACLFASSSDQDNPTIDVLNALGLDASAVGNHEFDQGLEGLTDCVCFRGTAVGLGTLQNGKVILKIEKFNSAGKKTVTARYLGNGVAQGSKDAITIRVAK